MSEKAKGRRGKRLKKNVVLEDDEAPQQGTQTTKSYPIVFKLILHAHAVLLIVCFIRVHTDNKL